MKTLTKLPIAIFLALATVGCGEAMDQDELEWLESELGDDFVDEALEEGDEDDFDLIDPG